MDNISQSATNINKMYSDLSYFDQYGGSVVMFIILIVVLFVAVSYTTVMRNIQPIKDDWPNQRCKPQVIPFAGLINRPAGSSLVDFTGQNFNYCVQNILTNITGYALQPISYMTYSIKELFEEIGKVINFIRTMLSSIRVNMTNIAQEILGRVANIMVPIQQIIISFKDAMGKVKGVLTAGLYTSLGSYYALKALLGAIAQFIITILIVLAALVIAMWIIPFTWPVAISMTAVFISISIPLAIMVAFMTEVLHVQTSFSIPSAPPRPSLSACFDKYTLLRMKNGNYKTIANVAAGDILFGNNMVTSKMVLDSSGQTMYNIFGTLVSAEHQIKYGDEWILVKNHPLGKRIDNYVETELHCLNTATKRIEINGETYMDWDELYDEDIEKILKCDEDSEDSSSNKKYNGDYSDIHRFFDGGFASGTDVLMNDGSIKNIEDVNVGDALDKNIKVFGKVSVNGVSLNRQYKYNLGEGVVFEGGPNLNADLERFGIGNGMEKLEEKHERLFHLITNEKYFYVGNIKFYHYDSNVELLLDRYRENYYL